MLVVAVANRTGPLASKEPPPVSVMVPAKVMELEVRLMPPAPVVEMFPLKVVEVPACCRTEAAFTLPEKVAPPVFTIVRALSGLVAPMAPVTLIVPVPGFRVRFCAVAVKLSIVDAKTMLLLPVSKTMPSPTLTRLL